MAWTPVELLSLSITGLDKRIGGLSDRAFDSAVLSEEPPEEQASEDTTQRSLLKAVEADAESPSDPEALAQATKSQLIEQTDHHKKLTPLGEYVLTASSR